MGSPMNDSWPREPQEWELENLTQLFKILGDPSRMKVLFQIGPSEACVSEVSISIWSFWKRKNFPKMVGNFWGKLEIRWRKMTF